jgi:hypothetical protein
MQRILLTVAAVFGLASGAWGQPVGTPGGTKVGPDRLEVPSSPTPAGRWTSGGMMMGLARLDGADQLHLLLPSGSSPFEQTVEVGVPPKTIRLVRTYSSTAGLKISARDVEALDTDGKAIGPRDLAFLLEKETPVVIFDNGLIPDGRELTLLKKGTVVLLLPVPFYGYGGPAVP